MKVNGFDWDNGNRDKCQKHGVSITEIEQLFVDPPSPLLMNDDKHSGSETRFMAVGQTEEGRNVFVGFTLREIDGQTLIRPITARYMHQREVDQYEQR